MDKKVLGFLSRVSFYIVACTSFCITVMKGVLFGFCCISNK